MPARPQPGDGVKRLEDALAGYPVADAQQGGPGPGAKVALWRAGRGRHVPAGRDHNELAGEALRADLIRELLAGHEHRPDATVRRPVKAWTHR